MGLRIATVDDLDLILNMANKFISATPYNSFKAPEKIKALVTQILTSDVTESIIILYDDVGMIGGMVHPFVFGVHNSATELAWWVEPEHRGSKIGQELITAFEQWAKRVGCATVTMVSIDDNVGKYYEKNGYVLCERAYLKEI